MREPFLINPPKRYARKRSHRKGGFEMFDSKRKRKANPVGETLITVGGNPMRYFHRRNPAVPAGLKGAMDIQKWGPLALTGGLSAVAAGVVPGMLAQWTGTNPWVQIGVRLAVAFWYRDWETSTKIGRAHV